MTRRNEPDSRSRSIRLAVLLLTILPMMLLRVDGAAASPTCVPSEPATCSLRELADLASIRIGSTAEPSETADPAFASILSREFNSLTPENALKWYSTQPSAGTWDFTGADAIVDFAEDNGMTIRGHTLVWAQDTYTPAWVRAISDPVELQTTVNEHITTTMNHFSGRIERWDVINEPLASFGTGTSTSVFWTLGPEWIADAFRLARSLDADAELWLNEYGSDWVPGKHEALLALVTDLVGSGVPIDGVGIQTHRLPGAVLDTERFAAQLGDFTALGLEVAITELDVPVSPTDPDAFEVQAAEYARVVSTCLRVTGCVEVTVWGLTDGATWLDSLGLFATPTRPLLFDTAFAPKPAYEAVRQVLAVAVAPPAPTTTGPPQPTETAESTLPVTGTSSAPLAATGVFLILGGVLLSHSRGIARRPQDNR
jgi:endo-1,4-beta-xylanase